MTCQVTAVFVVPETVAENCEVEPSLVADEPVTETEICGVAGPLEVVPPEHPVTAIDAASKAKAPREWRTRNAV